LYSCFLFSMCNGVNMQFNCNPAMSSPPCHSPISSSSQTARNPRSQSRLLLYYVSLCPTASHILLFTTLHVDSIMQSKCKCMSDNGANNSSMVMAVETYERLKIPG
jgi:hypothetical protein